MKYLAYFILLVGIVVLFVAFTMDGAKRGAVPSFQWKLIHLFKKSGQSSLSFIFYGIFIVLAGLGLLWRESST